MRSRGLVIGSREKEREREREEKEEEKNLQIAIRCLWDLFMKTGDFLKAQAQGTKNLIKEERHLDPV